MRPGRLRRSRGRTALLIAAGVLSLAVAVASGLSIASILYAESKVAKAETGPDCRAEGCLRDVDPYCEQNVCNFLVLGSDSREGLSEEEEEVFGSSENVVGERADTIIVVNVNPALKRTVILHVPRDLLVEIPGRGEDKINSAFKDGPNVMVQAIEELTGLQINHYVHVNFVGFQRLVDALGGVPICIDRPMTDRVAGLYLPDAGCYRLRGRQALAFVRARHVEGDVIPDFSRIARQQQFIRAVIQKALSVSAVFRLPALVRAAEDNLVRDENLSLFSLQDLTRRLASVGQEGVEFRVVPAVPVEIGGISYVQAVQPKARLLFDRIRKGAPLGSFGKAEASTPISPANITVRVYDADSGGQAEEVTGYLERSGFVVLPLEEAPPYLTETKLYYGEGFGKHLAVVSSYLPNVPVLFDTTPIAGSDVVVVVGPDFGGLEI